MVWGFGQIDLSTCDLIKIGSTLPIQGLNLNFFAKVVKKMKYLNNFI